MRGFLHMIFALVAGVATGWLSAVALIERYGFQTVAASPLWYERRSIVDSFVAPYSLSYYVNQGQLPPPGTALHFMRDVDDEGNILRGNCYYLLSGKMPEARYFSFTLDRNDAVQSSLGAGQMITESDGILNMAIAPYPVSGNRLLSATSGAQTLSLTIHEPVLAEGAATPSLPTLKKVRC